MTLSQKSSPLTVCLHQDKNRILDYSWFEEKVGGVSKSPQMRSKIKISGNPDFFT